ncbi:MAG: ATPase domain-containing protein [Candidatus Aenigmatarchaeota archaeon]
MNRIKTGITGFDKLVEGGIPEKDLILLSGRCGAGKTVFGLQFLFSSPEKEPGLFISFEEDLQQIKNTAMQLGWNADAYEKAGKIRLLRYDPFKLEDIFEIIENNIREINAKRVVVDSVSSLGTYVKDNSELRRMIMQISNMLRKNGCTSILTCEVLNDNSLSRFGVEEFVADGVILLHNVLTAGEYRRGLSVWKMRVTNHSRKIHPYKITEKGFVVYPNDTISLKG